MAKKLRANNWRAGVLICISMMLFGFESGDVTTMHDPTEPPAELIPAAKANEVNYRTLNLTAVFVRPSSRWAIINGQVYHEGDAIGEYIITNIDVDAVELIDSANNKEVLQLATSIKKPVAIKEE